MFDRITPSSESDRVTEHESAAVTAYDALDDAGCESIVTATPRRTRGTWIVPAETQAGVWNVHIDPRTGSTRIVRID